MKTIIIAGITLLIGFAIGTVYGWWTGSVDGQIIGSAMPAHIIQLYSQARVTEDIQTRDRAIDTLAMGLGVNFAVNNNLSPMAFITQPKADLALLDLAACWQLDHPNGDQHLFPPGSPSAARLDQVMSKYSGYYETTRNQQTEKRDKAKKQNH